MKISLSNIHEKRKIKNNFDIWSICNTNFSVLIYNQFKFINLKKYGIILNGKITDIAFVAKGSPNYLYEFSYNGKRFSKENSTGVKKLNFFIGKTFPVIFSPKTEYSQLLISPKDFEKFGLNFPDSLRWVLPYRNNKF